MHGAQDENEKIKDVRGLVANHNRKATLIEAKNKGHCINFEDKSVLMNVIRYVYSIFNELQIKFTNKIINHFIW